MSALGHKRTFNLLFDVIDWVPGREPKLRMGQSRNALHVRLDAKKCGGQSQDRPPAG